MDMFLINMFYISQRINVSVPFLTGKTVIGLITMTWYIFMLTMTYVLNLQ